MSTWLRARTVFDRVVAAVALVAVSPLVAALAVAVKRHDGGPALVGLVRVGRGRRPFRMWKVRTMRAAEPDGTATGPALAGPSDVRITPIGRRLRSRRLDELPQLLNVIRGEMAMIGPRPEAPDFVEHEDGRWDVVLRAAPGLTGATQVLVHDWEARVLATGRATSRYTDTVLPAKLRVDEWYVRHATPAVDAAIAWETVRLACGRGPGRCFRWLQRTAPAVP